MSKVMFTISYGIKPEAREQYLALIKEMKQHLTQVGKKNYSVFEGKGKRNQFSEVFETANLEEFDALEDDQDEKTQQLISRLEEFVDDNGMKYSTLVEID